jgi:hypothetical protein
MDRHHTPAGVTDHTLDTSPWHRRLRPATLSSPPRLPLQQQSHPPRRPLIRRGLASGKDVKGKGKVRQPRNGTHALALMHSVGDGVKVERVGCQWLIRSRCDSCRSLTRYADQIARSSVKDRCGVSPINVSTGSTSSRVVYIGTLPLAAAAPRVSTRAWTSPRWA